MTQWEAEAGSDEVRFVLWGVPHVVRKQDQYLVCLQGLPPQRRVIHLAVIGKIGNVDDPENIVAWFKRSGLFGLMAQGEALDLAERLKQWWVGKPTLPPELQGVQ